METRQRAIRVADLFCGGGGASEGLRQVCVEQGINLQLVAVNHWDIAIKTHKHNHPHAESICTDLNSVDPRKLVPGGKLELLIAAPECTHHSNARGGKPISDQSRASAWRIVEWASQIEIDHILIENVKEFQGWGPLGTNGRPLKKQKGAIYIAFLNALQSLGYHVETKVLNAADYGDPTSRQRLFIQAVRGRRKITWPEPTHQPAQKKARTKGNGSLFNGAVKLAPYRSAREIIDWSIKGESIYTRKRPLSPATLARIYAGLRKFCGLPFIVPQLSGGANRDLDQPVPTITTTSRGIGLCEPYIVVLRNNGDARSIDEPLAAICANGQHQALCQPFIVELRNGQDARSLDEPLSTIVTKGIHHAICQPFLIGAGGPQGAGRPSSVDAPLGTILTDDHKALIQPYIVPLNHGKNDHRAYSVDSPMPTVTSVDAWGLAHPFIVNAGGPEVSPRSVDEPLNTVLTREHLGIVQSFLVKYNGTGGVQSIEEPLDTVTSKDRFGLVNGDVKQEGAVLMLDIKFRMLQPHELAAAMSFPRSYVFYGNREQKVKQIGNAWPVQLGKALCRSILAS
jgi:DNA (cytosine-5)-methyltransferase 1